LHYKNYPDKGEDDISLEDLPEKVDLNAVTSVDSNITASESQPTADGITNSSHNSSTETLTTTSKLDRHKSAPTTTKITIIGHPPASKTYKLTPLASEPAETILLELHPTTSALASEWLDGLLMLLNQQPITKDTTSLVEMMEDWGVRLRMLNLRWEDVDWEAMEWNVKAGAVGDKAEVREVPSRDGLDEDYWYALPET
jgi:hypothetical protein